MIRLIYNMGNLPYHRKWKIFRVTLLMLQHQDNLEGLINWAKRKRLSGVRHYYKRLLTGTGVILDSVSHEEPTIVEIAHWAFTFKTMVFPPQYKKGFASQYKRRTN